MTSKDSVLENDLRRVSTKGDAVYAIRRDIFQRQRELVSERSRVKALSEEVENPDNVQRWRELKASFSSGNLSDILEKVRTFQRKLIHKIEKCVSLGQSIQEERSSVLEMENRTNDALPVENSLKASAARDSINRLTKRTKAVASELNMNLARISILKSQIEERQAEIVHAKRMYFDQQRREKLQELASISLVDGSLRDDESF
jgi:hypothetical protein